MKSRGVVYNFFKSIDMYASPVSLTYMGKASFPTFCGGVATMISLFICLYWWSAMVLDANLHPTRNFSLSSKTKLMSTAGGV
jgi:hypothetical protein